MKNKKKLSLSKESIRILKSDQLLNVVGGGAGTVRECIPVDPTGP
jgi:hypothetical protein